MHWKAHRVALFSFGVFLVAAPLRLDALIITQARKATTPAEIWKITDLERLREERFSS